MFSLVPALSTLPQKNIPEGFLNTGQVDVVTRRAPRDQLDKLIEKSTDARDDTAESCKLMLLDW